jgi:molybdopterin-guanine dinucleotide biosynthesis protein A
VITAIVLAGGRSSRFGSDKLAVELDGASILSRTVAAVEPLADIVVVAGPGLPDGLDAGGVPATLVADREPFGGPLAALANVLDRAIPDPVTSLALVVGGDMPRIVPDVLTTMLDRLAADPELDAVILQTPGAPRRQVLPLAIREHAAAIAARAALEASDRSLTGFVDRLRTLELRSDEWRALDPAGDTIADVDTRADLERLRSGEFGHERSP